MAFVRIGVRLVVCVLLFCLPFVLFIVASGKAENALLLIFPFFGAIPAVIGALAVFVPVERHLAARGRANLGNLLVPLAGALLVFGVALVIGGVTTLARFSQAVRAGDANAIWPFVVWSVLGALWGGLWRFTDWLVGRLRWLSAR